MNEKYNHNPSENTETKLFSAKEAIVIGCAVLTLVTGAYCLADNDKDNKVKIDGNIHNKAIENVVSKHPAASDSESVTIGVTVQSVISCDKSLNCVTNDPDATIEKHEKDGVVTITSGI